MRFEGLAHGAVEGVHRAVTIAHGVGRFISHPELDGGAAVVVVAGGIVIGHALVGQRFHRGLVVGEVAAALGSPLSSLKSSFSALARMLLWPDISEMEMTCSLPTSSGWTCS